jgi:biotin carboxyl carrier protein
VSSQLKNDKEVVLKALLNDTYSFKYASDLLKNDKEFVLQALNIGLDLNFVSNEFKNAKEVIIKAIQTNPDAAWNMFERDFEIIRMPLLSDTMTEGKIVQWNKKVGDHVKSDDNLADVETDKATMEVVGYTDGTLLFIGAEEGEICKVNELLAIIGK